MDRPFHDPAANTTPSMPDVADLRVMMDQGASDVAAGLTAPLAAVLAELDELADRIQARLHACGG